MVGGDRGHKKREEGRFADRKRRKLSHTEREQSVKERHQVPSNIVSSQPLQFCPWHAKALVGAELRCPSCRKGFLERRVVKVAPEAHAVAVDSRLYAAAWRRKLWGRLISTYHAGVLYITDAHVDFFVFYQIFRKELDGESFRTSARETNIKYLDTTWAVENFCKFDRVCPETGMGSGKVLDKGEICMIVPPVEVSHQDSKSTCAKVYITFGWITLTDMNTVVRAEGMPKPAEGWEHVEARLRDLAFKMEACDMPVNRALVKASEITLRSNCTSSGACEAARASREANRVHFVMPRPKPPPIQKLSPTEQQLKEKAEKQRIAASQLYNPYEAKKRPGKSGEHGGLSTFAYSCLSLQI
jgi:hypothetical protein